MSEEVAQETTSNTPLETPVIEESLTPPPVVAAKPNVEPGDHVRVHTRIPQGDKERIQIFDGVVIALNGSEETRTFTVRKIGEGGIGVERIWPLNSPSIAKIDVVGKSKVRRSKLYYLRASLQKMKELREKTTS